MTIYVTSHFVSKEGAIRYYKDYQYESAPAAVERKLAALEIQIGEPPLKAGEKLLIIDEGCRYAIEDGK